MRLRREQFMVNAVMNARHAFGGNAEIFFNIALGAVGNNNKRVKLARHFDLHIEEAIPAPFQKFDMRPFGMSNINALIHCDGVVDGADHRQTHIAHIQHAVTQRLVVMHNVILVYFIAHIIGHAHAECIRLRKAAPIMAPPFKQIGLVGENFAIETGNRVVARIHIQRGQLNQPDARVQNRIGRAGNHINVMAQIDQSF